jgi:hypothetical protein
MATECTPQAVRQVVQRFVDAFNRGDLAQLDQLVATLGFGWYSTPGPGQRLNMEQASDRSTLMAYFAARHRQRERLVLKAVDVTFTEPSAGGFSFRLTRSADDGLPLTAYNGKGQVQCAPPPSSLTYWAMDRAPWWPPFDLVPEAVALILAAAAIGMIIVWRRRKARHLAS